jgi:hypothetical protein
VRKRAVKDSLPVETTTPHERRVLLRRASFHPPTSLSVCLSVCPSIRCSRGGRETQRRSHLRTQPAIDKSSDGMALPVPIAAEWSETLAAVAVLGALVVAAALLSYFVVGPEYEKRLNREFQEQFGDFQRQLRRRSLGTWDIEAGSSDDDALAHLADRCYTESDSDASPVKVPKVAPSVNGAAACRRAARRMIKMHSSIGPGAVATAVIRHARSAAAIPKSCPTSSQRDWSPGRLTHRRKSESDALKQANVARADMLRRRVLLRKLEEEIERSKQDNDAQMKAEAAAVTGSTGSSNSSQAEAPPDTLGFSKERLEEILAHPADCEQELAVLAAAHKQRQDGAATVSNEAKRALRTIHDVLALHLSLDRRDVNKVTVFCNALLRHDGLNHLRALESATDTDVRALATAVIEKAVPAIWH